jgi:hypothetical protein
MAAALLTCPSRVPDPSKKKKFRIEICMFLDFIINDIKKYFLVFLKLKNIKTEFLI